MSDADSNDGTVDIYDLQTAAGVEGYIHPKGNHLPVARVKKIMKESEHTGMISADAPVVLARACEMLVRELTLQSWDCTLKTRRCTLQKQDVASAIFKNKLYYFLFDIFPPEELMPKMDANDETVRRPFGPSNSPNLLSPDSFGKSSPIPMGAIGTPGSYILPPPVPFPNDDFVHKGANSPVGLSPLIKPIPFGGLPSPVQGFSDADIDDDCIGSDIFLGSPSEQNEPEDLMAILNNDHCPPRTTGVQTRSEYQRTRSIRLYSDLDGGAKIKNGLQHNKDQDNHRDKSTQASSTQQTKRNNKNEQRQEKIQEQRELGETELIENINGMITTRSLRRRLQKEI